MIYLLKKTVFTHQLLLNYFGVFFLLEIVHCWDALNLVEKACNVVAVVASFSSCVVEDAAVLDANPVEVSAVKTIVFVTICI